MAKANPFASLKAKSRRITPRVLQGTQKKLWNEFKKKYHANEFAGLSMRQLYEWAQQHCGLTCSISCFRNELLDLPSDQ